jgi:hypothetical protein
MYGDLKNNLGKIQGTVFGIFMPGQSLYFPRENASIFKQTTPKLK